MILWLTGRSGAGKTTIAKELLKHLEGWEHLDGDEIRQMLGSFDMSNSNRISHLKRIGYCAHMLNKHGINTIVSIISPYDDVRQFMRRTFPGYYEVYINTPHEECHRRDPKELYAHGVICKSDYERPLTPDLTVDGMLDTKSQVGIILNAISEIH